MIQHEHEEAVPDIPSQLEEDSESVAAPGIREIRKRRPRREPPITPAQRARPTGSQPDTPATTSGDDPETKPAQSASPFREIDPHIVSDKLISLTPATQPRVRVQDLKDDEEDLLHPLPGANKDSAENPIHDQVFPDKVAARSVTTTRIPVQDPAQKFAPLSNPPVPPKPDAPVQANVSYPATPHVKPRRPPSSLDQSSFEPPSPRQLVAEGHLDRKADEGLTIRPLVTSYRQSATSPVHEPAPTLAAEAPPTVHVTIGRIEVRAIPPLKAPPRARPVPAAMGLDEYLRRRNGGGGR